MCECLDYSDGSRYQCLVCADLTDQEMERLATAREIASEQVGDERLWIRQSCRGRRLQVKLLQEELRRLHRSLRWPPIEGQPF